MMVIDLSVKFITDCGFSIPVVEMPDHKGLATYDPVSKIMEINSNGIGKYVNSNNIAVEDAIIIIISHELGHYLDPSLDELAEERSFITEKIGETGSDKQLEDRLMETEMTAENNASKNGMQFVPSRLRKKYIKTQKNNIIGHKRYIKNLIKWLIEKYEEKKELIEQMHNAEK